MRIVYLHQYFVTPDKPGDTRSFEMARRMVARGHDVHIVTSTGASNVRRTWEITRESGISVHWLPVAYDNKMRATQRVKAFLKFALRSSAYAARLKGDVVFATSTPLTIAIPGLIASRWNRAPLVFEVRDLWPEAPIALGVLRNTAAIYAARFLERLAYFGSTRVIALSPDMVQGVVATGYPVDQVHCIPNSCDVSLFDVDERVGLEFRAARLWLLDRPMLVYTGTIGRVNGLGFLVDLAQEMRRINPAFRFLVVGQGGEEHAIRLRAEAAGVLDQNFFIEPSVAKEQLPAVLNAATVASSFVAPVPELWKNSANKFFDSLAAGRPIVINHLGWQADVISETGCGVVLSHTDARSAAMELNAFVADQARMDRARFEARRLAHEVYARDILARQLIAVLEETVVNHRSRR